MPSIFRSQDTFPRKKLNEYALRYQTASAHTKYYTYLVLPPIQSRPTSTMAKETSTYIRPAASTPAVGKSLNSTTCTAASLAFDPNLDYKIRVLLHDLHNVAEDRSCEKRTS